MTKKRELSTEEESENFAAEYSLINRRNQRSSDLAYYQKVSEHFEGAIGTTLDKLRCFPKFVPLPDLGRFIAREKIFSRILTVQGSVVECGVHLGGGLMTWATLSTIYEPVNHLRKVIGFDTFEGLKSVSSADDSSVANRERRESGFSAPSYNEILATVELYDMFRPLGHIEKVGLVPGDACSTIPQFIEGNKHLVVALLYLDFDVYEPTRVALKHFLPRMPKGAVIAFDELNHSEWPGETQAVLDEVGIGNLRIERFPFQPQISFATIE